MVVLSAGRSGVVAVAFDDDIIIGLAADIIMDLDVVTVVRVPENRRGPRRERTFTRAYSMREPKTNTRQTIIQTSIALM